MEDKVPTIMENVFECSLQMINKDFSEYPEHRVEFFKLLKAINLYCFQALLKLDSRQFKFVIDSCMWASKHDNREVENTGLNMCIELMDNMAESDPHTSSMFFQQFFVRILQDVFFVVTDSDHKAGWSDQGVREYVITDGLNRLQVTGDVIIEDVLFCGVWQDHGARLFARNGACWHK
jgi:exportin-1